MTAANLLLTVQLLEPEGPVTEGRTVGLPADGADLAGQAHHGRLYVEESQVHRLRLVTIAVVRTRVRVCRINFEYFSAEN